MTNWGNDSMDQENLGMTPEFGYTGTRTGLLHSYGQEELVSTKESPIGVGMDRLDKAQAHLAEKISILANRLSSVRNVTPRNEEASNPIPAPPRSPLSVRINDATRSVDNMAMTVDALLDELEV